MEDLQKRLILNSGSASKANSPRENVFSPNGYSANIIFENRNYVKVEDNSTSDSSSFSSIDDKQFWNIFEGNKHTEYWIVKKNNKKFDWELVTEQEIEGKSYKTDDSKIKEGEISWLQGEVQNLLTKNIRKQRIKNECSEYLKSTVLSKLRSTKENIEKTQMHRKNSRMSIISNKIYL